MASVRKRSWQTADGEFKTAWVADYFDQGSKRHLKTFRTKKEADAWLVQARHEVQQGTHTPENLSITVAAAGDVWLQRADREKLERSTRAKYKNHLDLHITPLIGSMKLARLSAPTVEQFRDDLLGRVSRPMAVKVLSSFKMLLREAQRRGLVAQNVALGVQIRTSSRHRRKLEVGRDIPSKEEVNAIMAAATGRWRPLLVTAVFTGMRASELRGLRWDDVDFKNKVVHVRQRADQWGIIGAPKSEAGQRVIPMTPMVVTALKEWKLRCPRVGASKDDPGQLLYVFPSGTGRPESHANIINRGFDPIQVKAGVFEPHPQKKDKDGNPEPVAKYGMHALRHFFASMMIERGFSPKKLQELLGHSSIQMTFDTYGHLFPSAEDDQAKFAAAEMALMGA